MLADLRRRYDAVQTRIAGAAMRRGISPEQIRLVAVSKKQSVEAMHAYQVICAEQGKSAFFGENYVQEWSEKRSALTAPFRADMIGPLQSNKTRAAVALFDCVSSVHKFDLLERLDREAQRANKAIEVLLSINISNDSGKSGFPCAHFDSLLDNDSLWNFAWAKIAGLFAITKLYSRAEDARADFRAMRALFERFVAVAPKPTAGDYRLSMGMSSDFEVAIEEGASEVRIGTALFGERPV